MKLYPSQSNPSVVARKPESASDARPHGKQVNAGFGGPEVPPPRPAGCPPLRLSVTAIRLVASCMMFAAGAAFGGEEPKYPDVSPLFPEWTNAATRPTHPRIAADLTTTNVAPQGFTNSMDALDDKYKLAIGDRLSFRIVEDEEDPKPLLVTDSGELEVPYIGRFPGANKSCKELARELKAELEKEYYYQATVILAVDVMTRSRGKVYLVGAVRIPGPQDIPSDEVLTVSKAILRAGGCTDFADRRNVQVRRKSATPGTEDEIIHVDLQAILDKGNTATDLPLRPGDVIFVPERLFRF